jgi:hypothetical protein
MPVTNRGGLQPRAGVVTRLVSYGGPECLRALCAQLRRADVRECVPSYPRGDPCGGRSPARAGAVFLGEAPDRVGLLAHACPARQSGPVGRPAGNRSRVQADARPRRKGRGGLLWPLWLRLWFAPPAIGPAERVSRDSETWLHAELPRGGAACGDVMTVHGARAHSFTAGFLVCTSWCGEY